MSTTASNLRQQLIGFLGLRFYPGRYAIAKANGELWTGKFDDTGFPRTGAPLVFVSARHAYEAAREHPTLQHWRVMRLGD